MKIKRLKAVLTLLLATLSPQALAIPAEERAALIALYDSTNGDNWKNNTGWLGEPGTECSWRGIRCTDERVTRLALTRNSLRGSIPRVLRKLSKLEELDISGNKLTGNIPQELGQLSQLNNLYLSSNDLTGSIPPELGQLSQLNNLYLIGNDLTGSIPPPN